MKKKNIDLSQIHEGKRYLSGGTVHLSNNYLAILSDGDIAAVELDVSGDVMFENQLDNDWVVVGNDNKILIYNLNGKILPNIIFYYQGKFDVSSCLITDWFGNTAQPYVVREKMGTDILDQKNLPLWRETAKNVEDSDEVGDEPLKVTSGVKVVGKESLNAYKAKKLDEMQEFYKDSTPAKSMNVPSRIVPVDKKILKSSSKKGGGY